MEKNSPPSDDSPFRHETDSEIKISRSRPDEILRHDISDEELSVLSSMRRDWTMEAFWGFLGAALGAAKGAFSAIFSAYVGQENAAIPVGDLFEIILFFVCLSLGVLLLKVARSQGSGSQSLVEDIRNRKRTPVTG